MAESKINDTAVYLFEWIDATKCKYLGRMELAKKLTYESFVNEFNEKEKKIVFMMEIYVL